MTFGLITDYLDKAVSGVSSAASILMVLRQAMEIVIFLAPNSWLCESMHVWPNIPIKLWVVELWPPDKRPTFRRRIGSIHWVHTLGRYNDH